MTIGQARWARRRVIGTAVAVLAIAGGVAGGDAALATGVRPATVYTTQPSVAIAAARQRLGLFTAQDPPSTNCPLITPDALTAAAANIGAGIVVDVDPWTATTVVDPELRPSSVPNGSTGGLPVVSCGGDRPADDSQTRPTVFAVSLEPGVSFGDVMRSLGVDGALRISPAGLGGAMAGTCLESASTGTCVVAWTADDLVVGTTLVGPPSAVNTATAGALLTSITPTVIDTLAVVRSTPPPCTAAQLATTGITLIEEPDCQGGWALGVATACPPEVAQAETTTTSIACTTKEAFRLDVDGWHAVGTVTADCAEHLTPLGMTGDTAKHFVAPCNPADPSLEGGQISPGDSGPRVRALQIALLNQGYVLPLDSSYGPITEAAVLDVQESNGIDTVGWAGPKTRAVLGI